VVWWRTGFPGDAAAKKATTKELTGWESLAEHPPVKQHQFCNKSLVEEIDLDRGIDYR